MIDGRHGPEGRLAGKNFQTAAGLAVDGIPGHVTKAAVKLGFDAIRAGN